MTFEKQLINHSMPLFAFDDSSADAAAEFWLGEKYQFREFCTLSTTVVGLISLLMLKRFC